MPTGMTGGGLLVAGEGSPGTGCAMRLHSDALLTGDRTHFGTGYGKVSGGVTIHSPRSLAQVLFP
ncbi:MAG: hypothetical protein ACYCP0_08085 [Acidiferrobacteraceae bacterium]